jgi:hypothetical protein
MLFFGSDNISVGLTLHMAFYILFNPYIDKSEKNLEIIGLMTGKGLGIIRTNEDWHVRN